MGPSDLPAAGASGAPPAPFADEEGHWTPERAEALAEEHWKLSGVTAERLPGERDRNFRLTGPDGRGWILKISPRGEDPALLRCQHRAMEVVRAGARPFRFPEPVETVDGQRLVEVGEPGPAEGADEGRGREESVQAGTRLVRLLTWVPGTPLASFVPHRPPLLEDVGRLLGAVDAALEGLTDPATHRESAWDPARAPEVLAAHLTAVEGRERRRLLDGEVERALARLGPLRDHLPSGVIHGDGNDHNVLVGRRTARDLDASGAVDPPGAASPGSTPSRLGGRPLPSDRGATTSPPDAREGGEDLLAGWAVVGLVDFGDLIHSWKVADPAIAAAYAMLGKSDPLAAAAAVVRGYHGRRPLTEVELAALDPLIRLRLAVSVSLSARRRAAGARNDYLFVSEREAWLLLERLEGISPELTHYTLREACGLPPCPRSSAVVRWLQAHPGEVGPVLDPDPREQDRVTLDFSVGSADFAAPTRPEHSDGAGTEEAAKTWAERIRRRLERAGATLGVGRWDEARRWYTSDAYEEASDHGPGRRTVHLGADLFVEPGTPVLAPLDGVVHGARDNDAPLDYGPTVLLRHEVGGEDGSDPLVFHTLYGHLSRDSLEGMEPGRRLRRGEEVGRVGDVGENGGWAPHLHLQIVVDVLGRTGEFPGVARPDRREVWTSLSPDPDLLLRLPEGCTASRPPTPDDLLEERRDLLGPNLSVSYRSPLHIVRGHMQWLYDTDGLPYLDCVNNVAHVGHEHPRVVEALTRQASVLNTNTRYLHPLILEYARRLTGLLPDPLRVCFFVCSGSEANELALRLARARTGRHDIVVQGGAYHGNTGNLVAMSPYKFDGPGGRGRPMWVRVAPMPDPYRGRHRGTDAGRAYAEEVARACQRADEEGDGLAAFFAEPILSCGGQVEPPAGYLARAFRRVREAGGVCVADEVQVGFGRVGSHWWAFQTGGRAAPEGASTGREGVDGPTLEPSGEASAADAVPDILTLGKPMGNGYPLGAVVTTPAVAASFETGMEYFNTFGGNPVACAVGLAVLDVLEGEGLRERALRVGRHLEEGLGELAARHLLVGDVRGRGLFLGMELVLDPDERTPAPRHAAYVVERARELGVLLSTDGPDHNVVKIKPPLVFDERDAERLVTILDRVLQERPVLPG